MNLGTVILNEDGKSRPIVVMGSYGIGDRAALVAAVIEGEPRRRTASSGRWSVAPFHVIVTPMLNPQGRLKALETGPERIYEELVRAPGSRRALR